MAKEITNRKIVQNTILSVGAQIVALLVSLIINLIVPKYIDEYQYAYWQTYLLYAGYVGLLHLGILDGIVLRFSQYDYDELNKSKISFFFYILLGMLLSFSLLGILVGLSQENETTQIIVFAISVSIISRNLLSFASYLFQITNRIKKYVVMILIQKIFYGIAAVILVCIGVQKFYLFCLVDLSADLIGFTYSIKYNSKIYCPKLLKVKNGWKEFKETISAGVILLVANFSNNFIVGSTKIVIQNFWPTLVFGQVSFGFSITNLFLTFIMAISVVLFPSLKRMEPERLPQIYVRIRSVLTPLLLIAMLFYYPGCKILNLWLPQYKDSLVYAGILLPLIIYSTKVSLLTNNYLKAYRKEKEMLFLNVGCIVIEIIGLFIMGYLMKDLNLILIWTVIIAVVRSVLAERLVEKLISVSFRIENVFEVVLTILFIFCTLQFEYVYGACLYGGGVTYYLFKFRKSILGFLNINIR